MAKKAYDGSINYLRRDIDWGVGDASVTEGLPLSGRTVQQYIKDNFDHKAGWFYTDQTKGKCFVFASQEDCSTYLTDTSTYSYLVLGEFSAINEYVSTIDVINPENRTKTVFTNDKSNQKIKFKWDIKHKDTGISQDEDIKCTYTITRQGYTKTYTVFYTATQKTVETDITEYLTVGNQLVEGETIINILIEGQTHPVATSTIITYKIVNFSFSDTNYDVSKVYRNEDYLYINWIANGLGSKKLYIFLDGNRYNVSTIGSDNTSGQLQISCAGLSEGKHNILLYSSITFDGGATYYYSDILYRDFIISNGTIRTTVIAVKTEIPSKYLTILDSDTTRTDCYPLKIYDAEQYVQYKLVVGSYNYNGTSTLNVKLDNITIQDNLIVENEKETTIYFSSESYGTKTLTINATDGITYSIPTTINKSDISVEETHPESVEFFFSANGMSNDSSTKDKWTYSNPLIAGGRLYTATFNNFNWNSTSGWVDNGLYINADSSISFDYNPFGNLQYGKTFEIELETKNVSNDETIICDISTGNDARFLLKANAGTLISSTGINLTNKFKSEERTRISFVVNPIGSTNEKLTFVYVNGILSGGVNYGSSNYVIAKNLVISGSNSAQVWIKQIRVYNRALTSDEILNNYIRYRDTGTEMKTIYDKNTIMSSGMYSKDLMLKNLKIPVMTVIGKKDNMPAVKWLDTIAGKSDKVDVNILFENPLDEETSFYAEHITMTPQGTSSMVYPKRNYRIYTAYKKLANPDEFIMWYTHGYGMDQKDKWTEIKRNSKLNRKYRFKAGSQEAVRWTLKADFAESSGTHNTGTARLWNAVMRDSVVTFDQSPLYYKKNDSTHVYDLVDYREIPSTATIVTKSAKPSSAGTDDPVYIKVVGSESINGKRALETNAQMHARTDIFENNKTFEEKEGEVRTCVDGYPIAMFYQESENSDLVFMGKYNFNNDKSTESVFGFVDISTFDNAYNGYYKPGTGHDFYDKCTNTSDPNAEQYKDSMQCWELTNSGDKIALYITRPSSSPTSTDFRSGFEARYPDNAGEEAEVTEFNTYVKPFANWMVDMRTLATIERQYPGQPESVITAEYSERDQEYYETYVKDRTELHDISFWANDASITEAGYTLVSEMISAEDVQNFPNINKIIQYKKEGTDIINVQFVEKNNTKYEQTIKNTSNKIISWTNSSRFKKEKWDHFDVFKIAAYYIYLIRFGAVDQTVKNGMFTSEDGRHWYYINYDNDTILGVRNDGRLMYNPDIDRQYWDEGISDYAYAGYESTLWNCLENDDEFMNEVVPAVDDALYKAGLTYTGALTEFNTNQCQKWCEKIYNQDAQYKYVDSYIKDNKNYLDSMQGSRETHRNWWISKRFNFYDAKFANTNYTGNYIYFLAPDVQESNKFQITAGTATYYSIGVNNRIIKEQDGTELPLYLADGSTFEFRCPNWTLQVGSPVNIYSASNIKVLDFSYDNNAYGSHISQIRFSGAYSEENGTKLEKLILNGNSTNTSYAGNGSIVDLKNLKKLKYLDVRNIKGTTASPVTEIDGLNTLAYLEEFYSTGSNVKIIEFAKGAPINKAWLSSETTSITFNELSNLAWSGIKIGNGSILDQSNLLNIHISKCPNLSKSFSTIYNWYNLNKSKELSLFIDNVSWNVTSINDLIELGNLVNKNISGKIIVSGNISLDQINILKSKFGENCFNPSNSLYITDNKSVYILGDSSIVEGNSAQYSAVILDGDPTSARWSLSTSRDDIQIDQMTGLLTTTEKEYDNLNLNVILSYTTSKHKPDTKSYPISILKPNYPSISEYSVSGATTTNNTTETYEVNVPASLTGKISYQWSIEDFTDYVTINGSSTNKNVNVNINLAGEVIKTGKICVNIRKSYNDVSIGDISLNVTAINDAILITEGTNRYLLEAINSLGWNSEHPTYYLKEQAHQILDASAAQLCDKLKEETYRTNITSLKEFGEFTSVINLPNNAFRATDADHAVLKEIILPPSLSKIPDYCFSSNSKLERISIPTYVEELGYYSFSDCYNLSNITFESEEYLTKINDYAFRSNGSENINLPKSLEYIGNNVFYYSSIKNIFIPENVNTIQSSFTNWCSSLISIKVDPSNEYFSSVDSYGNECNAILSKDGKTLLRGCTTTIIPNNITSIGRDAFMYSHYAGDSSNHLEIPNTVTNINSYAFYNCDNIKTLKLSENSNYNTINDNAFYGCGGLISLNIPDNIETISTSAFFRCVGLKTLHIGKNVSNITGGAFGGINDLITITVDASNNRYVDHGDGFSNILYDNVNKSLHAVAEGYSFPSDLKTVETYAFYQRNKDDSSVLDFRNTNLSLINGNACAYNSAIKELYLPESMSGAASAINIQYNAFGGCYYLNKIQINAIIAPLIASDAWGTSGNTAGSSSGTTNYLYVYGDTEQYTENNNWKNNLLNPSHGKFNVVQMQA